MTGGMDGNRYSRNFDTLTVAEQECLGKSSVCVVGCGGIGGYLIEMLGRLGVGMLTVIDGDVIEESNLNRQILSSSGNMGQNKVSAAVARMKEINPHVNVTAVSEFLTERNGRCLLSGHHVIVDALDNLEARFLLQKEGEELGIPLVHGAVAGWYGQVSTILPGDRLLDRIYEGDFDRGIETKTGNLSFGPALIAAVETGEVVKILTGRGDLLRFRMLFADLLNYEFEIINLERRK